MTLNKVIKLSIEEQIDYFKSISKETLYDLDFCVENFYKLNDDIQNILLEHYYNLFFYKKFLNLFLKRIVKYSCYNIIESVFKNLTFNELISLKKYSMFKLLNKYKCFNLYLFALLDKCNDSQRLIYWFKRSFLNKPIYNIIILHCILNCFNKKFIKYKSSAYFIFTFVCKYYCILTDKEKNNLNNDLLMEIDKVFDLFKRDTNNFYILMKITINELRSNENLYTKYTTQLIHNLRMKSNEYFVVHYDFSFLNQNEQDIINNIKLFYLLKNN